MSQRCTFRRMTGRILLALGLLLVGARAQGDPTSVPPAPPDGLFDASSVLNDTQRASAVRSVAMARESGVRLFVALYSFIVGDSIEARAEKLKAAWCPDGAGLLVVADISTNQCTYLSHVAETEWLSTAELQRIFAESSAAAAAVNGTGSDKILAVIENLAPRLSASMARHDELTRQPVSTPVWWIFAGVTGTAIAMLAAGALVRWIRQCRQRRRRATTPVRHYFPTVAVSERFGAPFGGGVVAEVNFAASEPL